MNARLDLARLACFAQGLVEVQDLGSQLVLEIVKPEPGSLWLDACSGAGGKALQLADMIGPEGRIEAEDPRGEALGELQLRAERAGVRQIRTRLISSSPGDWSPGTAYDGVLVDAPCSGSGTWRRHPHLRVSTREADVKAHASVQLELLRTRARAVRPGGVLVYATCSLAGPENGGVAETFLREHASFRDETPTEIFGFKRDGPGLTIWPDTHDTDGFFMCILRRVA
jgi:16S rRNA (cytosine967-C5)-methyltransferase